MNVLKQHNICINTIQDVEFRATTLSTESFGTFITSISNIFKDGLKKIKDVFSSIHERFINMFTITDLSHQVKELYKLHSAVDSIVKNVDYQTVMTKQAPTIVGLKVNLHELSIKLLVETKDLNINTLTVIDEMDTFVSKIIADKDYIKSVNINKDVKVEKLKSGLEKFLLSVIDQNGVSDITSISKLLPNISSLRDIHSNVMKINTVIKADTLKEIDRRLKLLNDKIDIMINELTTNDSFNNSSKHVMSKIAYDLKMSAEYLSLVSSVYYIVNQNNAIVLKLINILK